MKLQIIGIICLVAVPIYSLPAEINPAVSSLDAEFSALRAIGNQPNAQFGERVKDWFRRVKNRIFGRKETTPSPLDRAKEMFTEVDSEDIKYAQENPQAFYVDLSKIQFDPKTDWGFHLGRWYFIRKSSNSMERNDWNTPDRTYTEWPTVQERTPMRGILHDLTSMATFTTSPSMENKSPEVTRFQDFSTSVPPPRSTVVPWKASTFKDVTTQGVITTNIATSTVATVDATTKIADPRENETRKKDDQSAEVIGP